jgi:FlaA1/EpsC-like NDP-sugar epimerase
MKNKEILITGGTGSLGKALTRALIPLKPKGIRIYSRSELNQFNMKQEFKDSKVPISYIIGDIRDKDRLRMAFKGVDYVINTAAMKRIEVCEKDPIECLKTNVTGVSNVVSAALDTNVKKVLQVSTDKAVYPTTLYGASKKCAEDLIINANTYSAGKAPHFMCVIFKTD